MRKKKRIVMIIDEASGISDKVWLEIGKAAAKEFIEEIPEPVIYLDKRFHLQQTKTRKKK